MKKIIVVLVLIQLISNNCFSQFESFQIVLNVYNKSKKEKINIENCSIFLVSDQDSVDLIKNHDYLFGYASKDMKLYVKTPNYSCFVSIKKYIDYMAYSDTIWMNLYLSPKKRGKSLYCVYDGRIEGREWIIPPKKNIYYYLNKLTRKPYFNTFEITPRSGSTVGFDSYIKIN